MNDAQALAKCVTCLLDNVTPQGNWGDFQSDWDPIITGLTCDLLLSCGLTPDTPWFVAGPGFVRCTLLESFRWLNNSVQPDGHFGTDFWDAARLGLLIEKHSLRHHFSAYASLKDYLLSTIDKDCEASTDSQWRGPGFTAAAIEYLLRIKDTKRADLLLARLPTSQGSDGSWKGSPVTPDGHPIISPIWHTAQCISALLESAAPQHDQAVKRALDWLKRTQDPSGHWASLQQYEIYFTAYAIMALMRDPAGAGPELRRAVEYLKARMGPDGKCSDLGGTLMCGLGLKAVVGSAVGADLTMADFVLARKNLARSEAAETALAEKAAALASARGEIEKYEKKYGDADIVFTKRQLFIYSLVALFLAVIGTVAGVYALRVFLPSHVGGGEPTTQSSAGSRTSPTLTDHAFQPPADTLTKPPSARQSRDLTSGLPTKAHRP